MDFSYNKQNKVRQMVYAQKSKQQATKLFFLGITFW